MPMRSILKVIDSVSDLTGRIVSWFALILVLEMVFEVTMRYAFNAPQIWSYETSMMCGAALYVLAFAYASRHRSHIRIGVIYSHLSHRKRAIIDVLGALFLFFPLVIVYTYTSIAWAWHAWEINETMIETSWFPPAAPIRTVVAIGFILLALQGGAEFVRDLYILIRNKPYD